MDFSLLSDDKIYTVSELNLSIKNNLEEIYPLLVVRGEVSNFYHHNKRHMYFDLKDENSKIKVVMFYDNNKDIDFEIKDGLNIKVSGYVSVYTQRGEYQIIASSLSKEGKGDLIEAFESSKESLPQKGYFDEKTKKKIPVLPKKIGLITSKGGAVIKDILSVLDRRFPIFIGIKKCECAGHYF
jgi:exodeoxyribonuclease VII large subunit